MTGRIHEVIPLAGGEWRITITTTTPPGEWYDDLKDKPIEITIKRASRKRSHDANAFCWALCSDIGKAMKPPLSKEEVYRMAIKAVGVYWHTTIPVFNLETVRHRWEEHGTGWFMEVVDDDAPGRKLVNLYWGSSTYNADEMRILLDWLVDQAEQMETPIPLSKRDQEEMLKRWGKK